jgi:hypothetical protein
MYNQEPEIMGYTPVGSQTFVNMIHIAKWWGGIKKYNITINSTKM